MAHGAPPAPRSARDQGAATASSPPMPDSHRELRAHKARSVSMGGASVVEHPAMAMPSCFTYVSPLRSLYMSGHATGVAVPHPGFASADLVKQMRQRYGRKARAGEGARRRPWMVPALALVQVIAFVVAVSHNTCDRNGGESGDCIFLFLRRFPFQPLAENPLLGPSAMSLLDFGALQSDLVGKAGQGWRLITTLSLHAGMLHLFGNLAGFLYVGLMLEREFGFVKVATIHYVAGFAGALASALFVHGRVSVGASGATMGMVGARLAEVLMNWDASAFRHRTRSIVSTSVFLLASIVYGLFPLMDNFMHVGGFIAGSLLGNVLLIRPHADWVKPQHPPCFPVVIYDVDDLPVQSKHSHFQKVLWIVSLNILVAGFVAALFAHYTGVDARRGCNWCHYMMCLPTDLWKCVGDRTIVCDGPPSQSSHLQVDCWGHRLAKPKTSTSNTTVQDVFTRCIKSCISS